MPAGFIIPCQPYLADRPPAGPEWSHEIKWDGFRMIARKDGERVRVWARTGTEYTACLERIRAAVAALPIGAAVIDGEAIAFDAEGRPSFTALRSRNGEKRAVLVAYDLLELDGQDIRRKPLQDRKRDLARLLRPAKGKGAQRIASGIVLSEAIAGKGDAMFREACRMGLEGIVSKRLGSAYVSGRTRNWIKVKNAAFTRE
jgi:bifunctional non-homologous end joining protein LigD